MAKAFEKQMNDWKLKNGIPVTSPIPVNNPATQQQIRSENQVSSHCIGCKGISSMSTFGSKPFMSCILGRKSGSCSGPYTTWEAFEIEADKDD